MRHASGSQRELCRDAVAISAVTGQGIPQLIQRIVAMLGSSNRSQIARPSLRRAVPVPTDGRINLGRLSRDSLRGRPGKQPAQVGTRQSHRVGLRNGLQ